MSASYSSKIVTRLFFTQFRPMPRIMKYSLDCIADFISELRVLVYLGGKFWGISGNIHKNLFGGTSLLVIAENIIVSQELAWF